MNNQKMCWVTGMLALALIFTGCSTKTITTTPIPSTIPTSAPTPVSFPVTVVDDLQQSITFEKAPTRIVVAGRATTLLLDALYMFPEAKQNVIAYESRLQTSDDFMKVIEPNAQTKAVIQKDAGPEQIAPLNPDLVILKTYMADTLGKPLETIGIKVLYLDMETTTSFLKDIELLGKVFSDGDRAETIKSYYQGTLDSVQSYTKDLPESKKPGVLLLQYSNKGGFVSFSIPSGDWIQTSLVNLAGGSPAWIESVKSGNWNTVTLEQVAVWNPDMIFIIWYPGDSATVVKDLIKDPTWAQLKAVKDQKIFGFPGDFLSWDQADTRWILGLTWLANRIHPEIFKETNIQESISVFYTVLYGLSTDQIEKQVIPIVKGSIVQ